MTMLSIPSRMCVFLRKRSQDEGSRSMATLKAISVRLKSVKNIQKITQSMKMVSAAKFSRAERDLKQVKPFGEGAKLFYSKAEIGQHPTEKPPDAAPKKKKIIYIAITSDRGLCGAVHSSVAKFIHKAVVDSGEIIKIVCVGDKARSLLQRLFKNDFLFVCQEVGRLPPTFRDASRIANEILQTEFDSARIIHNKFRSVVSNVTEEIRLYSTEEVYDSLQRKIYEDTEDEETVLSFVEFSVASLIFYALKEGACSEQASRMTAMDNASKNAADMISSLTLAFNRTRQAVITSELIEIISGAAAI